MPSGTTLSKNKSVGCYPTAQFKWQWIVFGNRRHKQWKGLPTATLRAYVIANGSKSQQSIKIKVGDDLLTKTHNPDSQGFVVEEINAGTNQITFTVNPVLSTGSTDGITLSKREIFRVQIEETIKFHFERQKALKEKRIKVLSLFSLTELLNYKGDEPFIKTTFEAAFNKLKNSDDYFKNFEAADVHKDILHRRKVIQISLDTLDTAGTTATDKKENSGSREGSISFNHAG